MRRFTAIGLLTVLVLATAQPVYAGKVEAEGSFIYRLYQMTLAYFGKDSAKATAKTTEKKQTLGLGKEMAKGAAHEAGATIVKGGTAYGIWKLVDRYCKPGPDKDPWKCNLYRHLAEKSDDKTIAEKK